MYFFVPTLFMVIIFSIIPRKMKLTCFCVMIDILYLNKFKLQIDVISEPDRRNKILFSSVMKIDFSRSTMKPVGV